MNHPADLGYQRGDRIALEYTTDPHTRLQPGDEGTVTSYDPRLAQLGVAWDDGSTLSMLLRDGDQVRLITPARAPAAGTRAAREDSRAGRQAAPPGRREHHAGKPGLPATPAVKEKPHVSRPRARAPRPGPPGPGTGTTTQPPPAG